MRYLYSKILFVFAVIFMFFASVTYSQIIRCGVQDLTPEQVQQLRDAFNQWLGQGNRVIEGVVTIPVSFHIIRYDNGSAEVTDQQVYDQIDVLNSSYSNTNFQFSLYSIERINNTSWTTHTHGSQQEIDMKQSLADDPEHILNFYTCALSGGLLGYATFPWMYPEDSYMHGVVIKYSTLPGGTEPNYNEGDTGTHEVGHFVGAFHTFQNGCTSPGDEVDDTPYEQSPAYGCPTGRNTCSQSGDDPIHNFMNYTDDSCMDHFTSGQSTRMDEKMYQYRPSMLNFDVNVTIDQRNSNNVQVGIVKKWEGSNWGNSFNPGTPLDFLVNSQQTILGDQTIISNQKYHRWVRNSVNELYNINHHSFTIQPNDLNFTSRFEQTQPGVTIKNSIESSTVNGGTVQFEDPWLIDYQDPQYANTKRNRGMDNIGVDVLMFKSRPSPFYPDYTTSYNGDVYQGVFLNQPYTGTNPVYYSVKVDAVQSIDLGGTIGTRDFYFQNWSAYPSGSASFQNEDALETPVVFKSDGATVQANLKGHLLTNSPTATAPNNQRKIVQGSNGYWAMVYVSMNNIWLSRSTDGVNGEREIKISDWDTGINGYPSIDIYNDLAYVVWQNIDWYGIGGWSTCFINVRRFDLTNNTLGPTITAASFEPPTESFISTPVIAYPGGKSNEIALAWRETDGIKIIHGDGQLGDDNITWGNVFAIPGTNSYSSNPSIAYASGYNFALCWSHNYSGNKIYYSTASKTYNPEWAFSNAAIISPGDWESNINPQITVINRYKPTIVWTSRNNIVEGRSSVHIRQRSGLETSDTWGNITTYSPSTSENLSPVIGDYYGLNKMDVLWNIGNTLYKASYNGTSWVGPTTLTTSGGSGVNINRTTAYQTKAIFKKSDNTIAFYNVGGTAPPSKIVASSEDKETTLPYRLNRHAIIELPKDIDSTAKGSISFEIAGISTIYNDSESKINYSFNENNLLASEPVKVAATGMQLSFSGAIYGSGLELPDKFVTTINEPLAKVILKDSKTNETLQSLWVNNPSMLNQVQNKTFGEFRNVSVDLNKYLGKTVYVQVEMFGKSKNIAPLIVDDYLILSDPSSTLAKSNSNANSETLNMPKDFTLMQNFPNPFNPSTTIRFYTPQGEHTTLKVYDILGNEIMTVVNEELGKGYHSFDINMSNNSSGVYFYSLAAGSFRETKKFLLLK